MATNWIEALTGTLEQKKQYKQYKARIAALPAPYAGAAKALDRYLMYTGGVTDGQTLMTVLGDSANLWERGAANRTPVRELVGDDPVKFADSLVAGYSGKQWIDNERRRFTEAIDAAIDNRA
ncbi:DUF1048 domain-containing protein [Agromyces salentinus]|uniref:DUF1048 domain-containing protein n=1 Tax=Agromyces salentinus TaxID=269421 RepID=A0ABN2MDQ7_9MICO|nr:DUF1048 domain-containing protein [Agromyces salentinus]